LGNKENRLDWLREKRLLFGSHDPRSNYDTTVFLGMYNGEAFLESRLRELAQQSSQDFYVLIVDNSSVDLNIESIREKLELLGFHEGRYRIVQNPVNLGGFGSMQLNLDIIPTEWVTFVHQDDQYLPKHISAHLERIGKSDESVVSISSDMGSLDSNGKRTVSPPRHSWFLNSNTPTDIFLMSVAQQVVPFPALSIRKSRLEADQVPWHTVGFSDSELTLLSILSGNHSFINQETVYYRENPKSESHSQGESSRNFSATLGLIRVFSSSLFLEHIRGIKPASRTLFATRLEESVRHRIRNLDLYPIVWSLALEQMTHAWGYQESKSLFQIRDVFLGLGENYAPEILEGLMKETEKSHEKRKDDLSPIYLDSSNSSHKLNESRTQDSEQIFMSPNLSFTDKMFGLLPYAVKRQFHRTYHFAKMRGLYFVEQILTLIPKKVAMKIIQIHQKNH